MKTMLSYAEYQRKIRNIRTPEDAKAFAEELLAPTAEVVEEKPLWRSLLSQSALNRSKWRLLGKKKMSTSLRPLGMTSPETTTKPWSSRYTQRA